MDTSLTMELKTELLSRGASIVGFADLREIPESERDAFPIGIAIGITWDKDALLGISDGPSPAYHKNYDQLNERLDALGQFAEQWLTAKGFQSRAKTQQIVGPYSEDFRTKLPHKTVATRAGLGWIGKCALLITPEFGPALRISSILTDAPLECGAAINESNCGDCSVCQTICPGKAVSGKKWNKSLSREDFWDADACQKTARARSLERLGLDVTLCGLCILRCPWTQKYLAE